MPPANDRAAGCCAVAAVAAPDVDLAAAALCDCAHGAEARVMGKTAAGWNRSRVMASLESRRRWLSHAEDDEIAEFCAAVPADTSGDVK